MKVITDRKIRNVMKGRPRVSKEVYSIPVVLLLDREQRGGSLFLRVWDQRGSGTHRLSASLPLFQIQVLLSGELTPS